jgi:hypothetical protein
MNVEEVFPYGDIACTRVEANAVPSFAEIAQVVDYKR